MRPLPGRSRPSAPWPRRTTAWVHWIIWRRHISAAPRVPRRRASPPEAALVEHDAAEAVRIGQQIEELLLAKAVRADGHLAIAAAGLVAMNALIDRRRELRPPEPWQLEILGLAACSRAGRDALIHHLGQASDEVARAINNLLNRNDFKPLRKAAERNVEAWRSGATPAEQPAPQAA